MQSFWNALSVPSWPIHRSLLSTIRRLVNESLNFSLFQSQTNGKKINKKAVLSQGEPHDDAVNYTCVTFCARQHYIYMRAYSKPVRLSVRPSLSPRIPIHVTMNDDDDDDQWMIEWSIDVLVSHWTTWNFNGRIGRRQNSETQHQNCTVRQLRLPTASFVKTFTRSGALKSSFKRLAN